MQHEAALGIYWIWLCLNGLEKWAFMDWLGVELLHWVMDTWLLVFGIH
jgi:hypothetical protein